MIKLKCSTCGLMKLENEFSRDRYTARKGKGTRSALYGRSYDCLACIRIKRKETHKRNPQIAIRRNAKRRKLYKTDPKERQRQRNAMLKSRYGLAPKQYTTLFEKQNGCCAICGEGHKHTTQRHLHVDHDHETGKIRGLLCIRCNTIIGNSKESIDILNEAIFYLRIHNLRHLESV